MAHAHFKDKLLNDLVDKSPPFHCPAPDCSYQTRERDKWSRHYGSVHGWIKKYLKQYFEENPDKAHSSYANDKSSTISSPDSFLSPSNTSTNESIVMPANNENQESPPLKVTGIGSEQKVKEKYILKVLKYFIHISTFLNNNNISNNNIFVIAISFREIQIKVRGARNSRRQMEDLYSNGKKEN